MSAQASKAGAGLAVENVSFAYGEGDGETVLRRVTLEVPEGHFLTLLGPSGSGKSTLLRLIAGLETPGDGRLAWQGANIAGPGIDRPGQRRLRGHGAARRDPAGLRPGRARTRPAPGESTG